MGRATKARYAHCTAEVPDFRTADLDPRSRDNGKCISCSKLDCGKSLTSAKVLFPEGIFRKFYRILRLEGYEEIGGFVESKGVARVVSCGVMCLIRLLREELLLQEEDL